MTHNLSECLGQRVPLILLDPKGTELLKERDGSPKAWLPFHSWGLFSLQLYTEKLLFGSFPVPDWAAMNWNIFIFHFSSSCTPLVDEVIQPQGLYAHQSFSEP